MKKIIALLLTLSLTLVPGTLVMAEGEEEADVKSEGVMTHEEYIAADLDTEVVIETCTGKTVLVGG